jgi:hypothetical protein
MRNGGGWQAENVARVGRLQMLKGIQLETTLIGRIILK